MSILRALMLALALVSGEVAAQTATRALPPFPPVMDLAETSWTASARATYEQLAVQNWTPAHEMSAQGPKYRGNLFCSNKTGPARVRYSDGTELRVVDVSCGGARSGLVRGFYVEPNGAMWVGDLSVSRGGLVATQTNQGVYRFANGNFALSDRTKAGGWWRAFGSPSGQMLVTLEEAGLFLTEHLSGAGYSYTNAKPWVRTRWILPGIGYFEGMSDYHNGFRFDGIGKTTNETGGSNGQDTYYSPHIQGGRPYYGIFTAIDGSYQIIGTMSWRNGGGVPVLDRLDQNTQDASFGTPGKDGMAFVPNPSWPVRIETRVATVLGPPGRYRAYSNVMPGRLAGVLASPEGAPPPPGQGSPDEVAMNWTPERLDAHYANMLGQARKAYWERVFAQSQAARQLVYDLNAERQGKAAERTARRQEREAEKSAAFAAAMGDVMADLSSQAERSVYDMQRSAAINQQAVDAASGRGSAGGSPPPTYDQAKSDQQAMAAASRGSSADLASSGSSSPASSSSSSSAAPRRASASSSGSAASEEVTPLTQEEALRLMSGTFTQEDGLTFHLGPTSVTIGRPAPGQYQRHDPGMTAVSNMVVTQFDSTGEWARVIGTGRCSSYQGYHESGARDLNTYEPCRWQFNISHRFRTLGFGAPAAQIGSGERKW